MQTARTALLLTVALMTGAVGSITVDETTEYQTMDGFGALVSEFNMHMYTDKGIMQAAVQDLGVSIMRFLAILQFEETNENDDASLLDLTAFNTAAPFATQMGLIRDFEDAAMGDLRIDKYFVSPLSPMAFMKTNSDVVGGSLRPDMYEEWAEHLAAYCKAVKQQTGVDLYSISLENEPEWEQSYASCVITPTEMRDLMRVVGPRFESEGLGSVKLMWAETVTNSPYWGQYLAVAKRDSLAGPYCGIYAVHSYLDGVQPADPGALKWAQIRTAVNTFPGLPLWMSETSGYEDTWEDGMAMGSAIFSALKYGQVEAWVWHNINTTRSEHRSGALMYFGQPTVRYHVAKQFFRWIRPGAVMIEAVASGGIGVAAFHHRQDRTLTLVCINEGPDPVTAELSGNNLPPFTVHRTSATEGCVDAGTVTGMVTLEPSSITTLVGTGWEPQLAARATPVPAHRSHIGDDGNADLFDLSGRNQDALQMQHGARVLLRADKQTGAMRTKVHFAP